jgi:hypothetical protein
MSLADYQQLVDDLVRDKDQVISSGARDAAIEAAVQRYSVDAPRVVVEDVTSAGGSELDVPTHWLADTSALRTLEYPIGQLPPSLVNASAVAIYTTPTGEQLRLLFTLVDGDQVRLTYTGAHRLDADADTIPARHRQPVAALAAATLCGQLSSFYATEGSPTIGADTTDHQSKSEKFSRRARDLRAEYTAMVSPAPTERNKGASATTTMPSRDSLGRERLFHPPRRWSDA